MGDNSKIEWTDATWNPVTGCDQVSPGCDHCYALTMAERFRGTPGHYFEHGFDVQLRPDKLLQPLRWPRPRKVFVNSMSDLFHTDIPDDYIASVFAVMACAPQHTFQVLTKRHARMRALLTSTRFAELVNREYCCLPSDIPSTSGYAWPLRNLWLGVSAENQQWADIRIPALLETPTAVRFVSAEPLLGPISLCRCDGGAYEVRRHPFLIHPDCPLHGSVRLDWIIAGGESGRDARPMHPGWARQLRDQCQATGVAFLFKQWGEWTPSPGAPGDHWELQDTGGTSPWSPDSVGADLGPWSQHAGSPMRRVGKRSAGRVIDGRTWDEYPNHSDTATATARRVTG